MPGLGLSGNLTRPQLTRALSLHPSDDFEGMFPVHPEAPTTPHEPLSLDWNAPNGDSNGVASIERPANPAPISDEDLEISLPEDFQLLPAASSSSSSSTSSVATTSSLPALPPLEINPLGGPLTRSFSTMLQDDSKFFRPVPAPVKSAGQPRRILAVPVRKPASSSSASSSSSSASRKRASPEPAPLLVATAPAATAPLAAPRKKRRGMRPGTYMCLFKGELYECPHGCDIVEKGLLYDLLRRQ